MGESYDMKTLVQRGFEMRDHIDIIYSSPTNNSNRIMKDVYEQIFRKYKIEHKISKHNNNIYYIHNNNINSLITAYKQFIIYWEIY